MKSYRIIFALLPLIYACLGYCFYTSESEVLGVVMIIFSILFGLLVFLVGVTTKRL